MNQKVALLPYGKRRLLEIALAIACRPRVLLLDEPVAGVPEGERQQILETIDALPAEVTVLLIEHDMDLVFNFARSVTVLVNGAIFAEGDAAVDLGRSAGTGRLPRRRPRAAAGHPRRRAAQVARERRPRWLTSCASKDCGRATARRW